MLSKRGYGHRQTAVFLSAGRAVIKVAPSRTNRGSREKNYVHRRMREREAGGAGGGRTAPSE